MAFKSGSKKTSEFYYDCRNGLIDQVREKLPKMSLEDIDKIQANGSTALHAACFYGHIEIVKLLLEKGANRSIKNTHNCIPYDEIEVEEIKKLFQRPSITRFSDDGSGHIDWIKYDAAAEKRVNDYRHRHNELEWKTKNINHRLKYIKHEIAVTENDRINLFLEQAQKDPYYLLKAYTVESDFYIKINKHIARKYIDPGTNIGITYFIDFFYNYPSFGNLSFKGKVYRQMSMTHDDFKQYSVGTKLMNNTFISTTKDRKFAEEFLTEVRNNREKQYAGFMKLSVLCAYEILYDRSGLNLEDISEYNFEKEVLIGPYTPFKITTIRQIDSKNVEIDLRECGKGSNQENDEDDDEWD